MKIENKVKPFINEFELRKWIDKNCDKCTSYLNKTNDNIKCNIARELIYSCATGQLTIDIQVAMKVGCKYISGSGSVNLNKKCKHYMM